MSVEEKERILGLHLWIENAPRQSLLERLQVLHHNLANNGQNVE